MADGRRHGPTGSSWEGGRGRALFDWMMPEMDGLGVCRRSRQAALPDPPCLIFVTSRTSTEDVVAGLEVAAYDYITKPDRSAELKARIKAGRRVLELQQALAARARQLQAAMSHVKTLQGLLPICSFCHKTRNDQESWERLESCIPAHSEARFTHGICPDCLQKQLELLKWDLPFK